MGTTTTTFALNKPTVGGDDNAWGTDLNANADKLDDLLDGTTAIKPNLSEGLWKVGGTAVTATAAELNKLDGLLPTTTELNFVDGVTSAIQTQLNAKSPIDNPTFTGDVTAPDIRLTSTGDVSLVSTTHAFQIGADASLNLIADSNEIQARSNGAAAALNINNEGGNVVLGGGTASSTITINGLASGAGIASQAEAEAGTVTNKLMTPLRAAQAIAALAVTNSYTLLGTINTTSGASQTLSGLTLTNYTALVLEFRDVNVSSTLSNFNLRLNSTTGPQMSSNWSGVATDGWFGVTTIMLGSGVYCSTIAVAGTPPIGQAGAVWAGDCDVTNASTSVTVALSNNSFTSGSILVYGVR